MENNLSSQFNNEEINSAFNLVFDTINGYVGNLKKKSSDEILNGSISEAQKLIDEILPYEGVVKKLVEAKLLLENIQSGNGKNVKEENFNSDEQKTSKNDSEEFNEESAEITPKEKFRVPILKALIYLGGSASIDKVVEFVKPSLYSVPDSINSLANTKVPKQNSICVIEGEDFRGISSVPHNIIVIY